MSDCAPTYADLRYADTSPVQLLDLYLPHDQTGAPLPLVVVIHGGAFLMGDKRSEITAIPALLERGYAIASIGYRLSGEATFPAAVQDCKAGLRWLSTNVETYGLDRSRFALWGASAGGHLAAMLGVTGDQPTPFDTTSDPAVDASVAAVIDWFGPTRFVAMDAQDRERPPTGEPDLPPPWPREHDDPVSPESRYLGAPIQTVPELATASDPTMYVPTAATLPPFLIVHGDGDHLVPHLQSVLLADELRAHGGKVDLRILPGFGHGGPGWVEEVLPASIDWLDATLGPGA
ncbi:alpha/beta hydrolase fold domain-containing protein [Longivirga aurantiaca]|uniref:Alpha/beta hydrolase fold domain-containing protein n=1 Tax=Longivirga aurantiaca TaxID=1837743 RepID=A0ABW1SX73_9ACTN